MSGLQSARQYGDDEVQTLVSSLMKDLPVGSSVSTRIENMGRSVNLDVRLPDGAEPKNFEFGWVGYGGTIKGKSRPGRQGPPFDEVAVRTIVKWSAKQ